MQRHITQLESALRLMEYLTTAMPSLLEKESTKELRASIQDILESIANSIYDVKCELHELHYNM